MSDNATAAEAEAADHCCTSCGTAAIDEIKLKDCDKCDLARYCSDQCKQEHRQIHEASCMERAAELRDELLFKQPESSFYGDCPICFLPLPLDMSKSKMISCCCKTICIGCALANRIREIEQRLEPRCSFCRALVGKTDEEVEKNLTRRAAAKDMFALGQIGATHYNEGDYDKAFEYYTRAAESGDAIAHGCLSDMYRKGEGVEKSEERQRYHLEEAAIAGHPDARYYLGVYELENEGFDRAVKHWIIAANLGYDDSLQRLRECYKGGHVSKDDFAAALRAHQAAVDATKSPQRETAEKFC